MISFKKRRIITLEGYTSEFVQLTLVATFSRMPKEAVSFSPFATGLENAVISCRLEIGVPNSDVISV